MRRTPTLLMLLVLSGCLGCGGYGEVSPAAYDYAKSLYNIAGRKAESRLDAFEEQLAAAAERGEVTAKEHRWLTDIADQARAGEWQDASQAARRMLEDQVR